MCGRYYRRSDKQRIGDAFNISDLPSSLIISEDYNVAPTTFQPVIRNDKETGEREPVLMRWGLVAFFTKQLSDVKGISTINARAEGIEKSRTWRTPFQKRRCLVPADGYHDGRTTRQRSHTHSRCGMMLPSPSPGCGTPGRNRVANGFSPTVSSRRTRTSWPRMSSTECPSFFTRRTMTAGLSGTARDHQSIC